MFETFTVRRHSQGLIASLDADRFALDAGEGADAAGAADGSPPSSDDAHFADGDGTDGLDAGDGAARAGADDPDDEEFEDAEDQGTDTPAEERIKKLASALKKAKRKLGTTRAERQRMKELKDRGVNLDDLYADSREYRRLMTEVQRNPKLRALLSGSDTDDAEPTRPQPSRRAANDTDDFTFDESPEALGFDPKESKANQVLANGLKRVALLEHTLEKQLARLQPDKLVARVDRLDQRFEQQTATAIKTEWTTATNAAAEQIKDPGLRTVFKDLMLFAREREGGKRRASDIVNHYLKQIGVAPAQASRASAAAAATQRNRVAHQVTQLPRPNGSNATPAPARKTRETVADVNRRLRNGR